MPPRRKKTPPDPRLVALSDVVIDCRADRHVWDRAGATYTRYRYRDADTLERRAPCLNQCGCVQVREVVEYGAGFEPGDLYRKTAIDYSKAKGYLNPEKGTGHLTRSEVRREQMRRVLDLHHLPIVKRGD